MEVVIEQAKIIYPGHDLHGKTVNLRILNGIIDTISSKKIVGPKIIKSKNLHLSPGWMDIGAQTGDPGFEHRETTDSLAKAALRGGYTTLALFPNTKPTIHSKSEIDYLVQKNKSSDITIYPIGAISKYCQGKELAEMIDMRHSGAIAFSDGKHPIQDTGMMVRAMVYAKHFDGLLINQPQEETLSSLGLMHEGIVSQRLGLKGIPEIAETIMLKRDFDIAAYTQTRILHHLISTASAVQLVKGFKKNNTQNFASVSYLNLVLNETALDEFDSVFKQSPPLRSKNDQRALLKAVQDETIEIICSNHIPLEIEKKDLEYAYADHGAIGLETAYAAVNTHTALTADDWVRSVSINPRIITAIPQPEFKKGSLADLTIFDPEVEWTCTQESLMSLSKNSPFIGHTFRGKIIATIHKGKLSENN